MVTSRALENYCADIEGLLREGTTRTALRLGLALPDICAALEDAHMHGSAPQYAGWCAQWMNWEPLKRRKPIDGTRLYTAYARNAVKRAPTTASQPGPTATALRRFRRARDARSTRPLARSLVWQPVNRLQAYQVQLTEALLAATRRWYSERGGTDAMVQRNLGKLLVK